MLAIAPDIERIVRDFLVADPDVYDDVFARVSTAVPSSPQYPHIVITQVDGGARNRYGTGEGLIDIDVYGSERPDTSRVARACVAALLQRGPGWRHQSGLIVDVTLASGLRWFPDSARTPPTTRYQFSVSVTARR